MQVSKRIALNTASNWTAQAAQAVIGFFMVPFLLNELGKAGYGLIGLVGVIMSFTTMADMGLRAGLGRNLSEQVAKKDRLKFNQLVSTGMAAYLVIGSACAAFLMAFAPLLARWVKAPPELIHQAVFLIRWYGGISILVSFLAPVYSSTITANNRFDIANYVGIGTSIAEGLGYFVVLGLTHTGLMGWTAVALTSRVAGLFISRHIALRIWPDHSIRIKYVSRDTFRALYSLGWKMFVFALTDRLSVRSDPLVITAFMGPGAVAVYTAGQSLPSLGRRVIDALRSQLHPITTGYHVTGRREQLREVLFRGTQYTMLLGIPVCVFLAVFAHPVLHLWLGKTPIGESYCTTAWIMIGWVTIDMLSYASGSTWAVLLGMKRLNFLVWTQSLNGVINILASIYLVGFTSLGVAGAIVPTIVIAAIRRPIISAYVARVCGTTARRYFRESLARPMTVLLILGGGAWALRLLVRPDTWMSVVACLIGVGLLWLLLCWWVGFDQRDRDSFLKLFTAFASKWVPGLVGSLQS